jgi:stress responsive alpha/beta barrel protein
MIVHVILFTPRADLSERAREELLQGLRTAASTIPSIRRFRFGPRVTHGLAGYEQMMRDDFRFAALVEFDDMAGLKEYLSHPAHAAIGRHFTESAERSLAYDFDLADSGQEPGAGI